METKLLHQWLAQPNLVSTDHKNSLDLWIKKYPFTALFHVLNAKLKQQDQPSMAESYIQLASVYAASRKKLFAYMQEDEFSQEKISAPTIASRFQELKAATEKGEEVQENKTQQTTTTETNTNQESHKEENKVDNIDDNKIEAIIHPADMNAKMEPSAIEITTPQEQQEKIKVKKEKKKQKKKHKKKEKPQLSQAEMSFIEWLQSSHQLKNFETEAETEIELTEKEENEFIDQIIQAGASQVLYEKNQEEHVVSEKNITPLETATTERQISKLAKRSIAQNDDNVTETFAKILELQKNYDKAIQAYEKLSLKYPEKSAYFADRIDKIKKKI